MLHIVLCDKNTEDMSQLEYTIKEILNGKVIISKHNNPFSLRSAVDSIQRQVNSLEKSWQSDASSNMLSIMNKMTPVFERFESIVNDYSKFLSTTADRYSRTEESINEATNELNFK